MDMEQLFFELSDTGYNLRGHSKRLTVNRCRLDSRKYFFSNRVVHHWNNLTQEIVDARSVNVFNRGGFNGRPLVQWPTRPLGCWALEAPGPRGRPQSRSLESQTADLQSLWLARRLKPWLVTTDGL